MSEPDQLYTLRNQVWLGHYSLALDEGKNLLRSKSSLSAALRTERDEFVARSLLALGRYGEIGVGVNASGTVDVGVKLLQLQGSLQSGSVPPPSILSSVQSLMSDPAASRAPSAQLYAAHVRLCANDHEGALRLVSAGTTLEHMHVTAQIHLRTDRLDLAEETVALMRNTDEDSSLTHISSVHVALAAGSSRSTDATYTLAALSEQYGPSPLLMNLQAAALVVSGRYDDAEAKCRECLGEDPDDVDAMINLVTCLVNLGKYGEVDVMVASIKRLAGPDHSFVKSLERVEGAFDRVSSTFAAGIAA